MHVSMKEVTLRTSTVEDAVPKVTVLRVFRLWCQHRLSYFQSSPVVAVVRRALYCLPRFFL